MTSWRSGDAACDSAIILFIFISLQNVISTQGLVQSERSRSRCQGLQKGQPPLGKPAPSSAKAPWWITKGKRPEGKGHSAAFLWVR